jgi:hypothetical protein
MLGFVVAALRNQSFLCGAIAVTAVIAMLSDLAAKQFTLHLLDSADLLMLLLAARCLHLTRPDDQLRPLIQGMLRFLVMMLLFVYVFV